MNGPTLPKPVLAAISLRLVASPSITIAPPSGCEARFVDRVRFARAVAADAVVFGAFLDQDSVLA